MTLGFPPVHNIDLTTIGRMCVRHFHDVSFGLALFMRIKQASRGPVIDKAGLVHDGHLISSGRLDAIVLWLASLRGCQAWLPGIGLGSNEIALDSKTLVPCM